MNGLSQGVQRGTQGAGHNAQRSNWQARPEAGSTFGLRLLSAVANLLGRRVLHLLLVPVAAYFFLVRGPERLASRQFLTIALQRPVRDRDIYRHFLTFARVAADRFFILSGKGQPINIKFVGEDVLQQALATGNAGIFVAAHLGSFEAARVVGPQLGGIRLRIVLDRMVGLRFIEFMESVNAEMAGMIINSEQDAISLGLQIAQALKSGDWVGFLGDRHRPGDRTATVRFFGQPAEFPVGAYQIASTFGAPVICLFCHCVGSDYEVHCELLSERLKLPRATRAQAQQACAQRYAEMLERHARAAPFSWFNFFDFWAR